MDDKRKITVYINEETYQKMSNYISCNYNSSYGATSQTVDYALNSYLWTPASITPHAIERSQLWKTFQEKLDPEPYNEVAVSTLNKAKEISNEALEVKKEDV